MLRIAVCDDNEQVCDSMSEFCASYLGKSLDYELTTFHDGMQLINSTRDIDILFLDVAMPLMNGFDVAEELNKRNRNVRIIFLTNHPEMMQRAFKVNAFRYLIKPVKKTDLIESLSNAIKEFNSINKVIVDSNLANEKTDVIVFEKDINYIEAIGDGTVIYTISHGNIISKKTLKYWSEILTASAFFQTHKSFVVSFAHVTCVKRNAVVVANGVEVPLSKRKAVIFNECLIEFIKSL